MVFIWCSVHQQDFTQKINCLLSSLVGGTFRVNEGASLAETLRCSDSGSYTELFLAGYVDSLLIGNCSQVFLGALGQRD